MTISHKTTKVNPRMTTQDAIDMYQELIMHGMSRECAADSVDAALGVYDDDIPFDGSYSPNGMERLPRQFQPGAVW